MKKKRTFLADKLTDERLLAMLREPVGTPIDLTREEAIKIVEAGIGGRPDLPPGDEYVRRVRGVWKGLWVHG